MGFTLSRDVRDPMESLFADLGRNVRINGKHRNKDKIFKDNKAHEDKDPLIFEEWLNREFSKDNIQLLKQHYSQGPMIFISSTFTVDCAEQNRIFLTDPTTTHNIYEENGEIYFRVIASNFKVSDMSTGDRIKWGEIKGQVEGIFKLTANGFEIQTFKTDSTLLNDMFLGNIPNKQQINDNIGINKLVFQDLNKIELALEAQQKKLLSLILTPDNSESGATKKTASNVKSSPENLEESQRNRKLEIASVKNTLKAIKQYKENKIDLEDLQTAVDAYKKQADTNRSDPKKLTRFFSRNVKPTTTKILNDLQAKLKSIEISQKKQKSATLRK